MEGDPDDPFTKALRGRYNELEVQKSEAMTALADLDEAAEVDSGAPGPDNMGLLDLLPYLSVNLARAPAQLLRTLFEVVQLVVQIHEDGERATLTITLPMTSCPRSRWQRKGSLA